MVCGVDVPLLLSSNKSRRLFGCGTDGMEPLVLERLRSLPVLLKGVARHARKSYFWGLHNLDDLYV